MLICAICKKPIQQFEVCAIIDGKMVHVSHRGVIEVYKVKADDCYCGTGAILAPLPYARPAGRRPARIP